MKKINPYFAGSLLFIIMVIGTYWLFKIDLPERWYYPLLVAIAFIILIVIYFIFIKPRLK